MACTTSACARTATTGNPTPAPSATAVATVGPVSSHAAPRATAKPAAEPSVAASHAVAPALTPAPVPTSSPVATPAGPQILSLSAKPTIVRSGQSVVWDVRTTPDVTSVTASVTIYSFPLVRVAPGHFALTFGIPPNVPGVFHGDYNMNVVAKDAAGNAVSRHILLTFE